VSTSTTETSSYAELIHVLDILPVLVREKRRRLRLSLRDAADLAGVSFSTISRFEEGADCTTATTRTLLAWVGEQS